MCKTTVFGGKDGKMLFVTGHGGFTSWGNDTWDETSEVFKTSEVFRIKKNSSIVNLQP